MAEVCTLLSAPLVICGTASFIHISIETSTQQTPFKMFHTIRQLSDVTMFWVEIFLPL